jgi:hypothetical protein
MTEAALEARARRLAAKCGWRAMKSRWRRDSIDNHGGFMVIDPLTRGVIYGSRFDLTAEEVIHIATDALRTA